MVTQTRQQASNRRYSVQNTAQIWLFFVGDCPKVTEYLAQRQYLSYWGPVKFIDALLRGYGQLIPQNAAEVQQGLTVYNPLLVGLITPSSLPVRYGMQLQYWHWFLMLFAAILSVYVTSAFSNIFGSLTRFPLPCFTMPFNVVQPVLFLCIVSLTSSGERTLSPLTVKQLTSSAPTLQNMESHHTSSDNFMTTFKQSLFDEDYQRPTDMKLDLSTSDKMSDGSISAQANYSSLYASSDISKNLSHVKPIATLVQGIFDNGSINTEDQQNISRMEGTTTEFSEGFTGAAGGHQSGIEIKNEEVYSDTSATTVASKTNLPSQLKGVDLENKDFGWKTESSNRDVRNLFPVMNDNNDASSDRAETTKAIPNTGSVPDVWRSPDSPEEFGAHRINWGEVFSGIVLSMARVYGSNHPQGAILIYAAVLLCSPILTAFAIIGATAGTLTGALLTDPETYNTADGVYEGAWGSNGLLCAMAIGGYYFVLTWQAAVSAIFSAMFATTLQFVLIPAFKSGNLNPMSLPFNLSALLFLCVMSSGAIVRPKTLTTPEKHRSEYQRYLHMQVYDAEKFTQEVMEEDEQLESEAINKRVAV